MYGKVNPPEYCYLDVFSSYMCVSVLLLFFRFSSEVILLVSLFAVAIVVVAFRNRWLAKRVFDSVRILLQLSSDAPIGCAC